MTDAAGQAVNQVSKVVDAAGWGNIEKSDTWSLVEALRSRTDLAELGRAALRLAHPDAPDVMIDTAAFHLFSDGCKAAVEWLASLERFIQRPRDGLDYGATWHLLYHLYNWQQFQALLPCGPIGLAERLGDVQQFLAEGDAEAANLVLTQLRAAVDGAMTPPDTE